MTASSRTAAPATLPAMTKTAQKFPSKYRLRRIDGAPDALVDVREPFTERDEAEKAAVALFGEAWAEEYEVYQYTTGTTKTFAERRSGKNPVATFSLPAEDIAYVDALAKRDGRTKSSVIREGVELVRKKHGKA